MATTIDVYQSEATPITLASTLTIITCHYPILDLKASGGEARIAYCVGLLRDAVDTDAAPAYYFPISDGTLVTRTAPGPNSELPWKLAVWKSSGTVTLYAQGMRAVVV